MTLEIVEEHRRNEAPELGSRVLVSRAGELLELVADRELSGAVVISQERVDDPVVRCRVDHARTPVELPAVGYD